MIKANELRLNNIVSYKGKVGIVKGFYENDNILSSVTVYFDQRKPVSIDELEPIPLTPEWLERCGFKRGGQHGDRNVFYPTGIHRINIELSGKDEYGYLLDGHLIKGHMRLKYLHQLQNLYFALCGIELEINPL